MKITIKKNFKSCTPSDGAVMTSISPSRGPSRASRRGTPFQSFLILFFISSCQPAGAQTVTASFYTLESVKKEGNSGVTASGKKYNENLQTFAHRKYRFGTILKITNPKNGKWIYARCNDRGPSRWTHHDIDLTPRDFELRGLNKKRGVAKVKIKKVKP